MNRYPLWKYAIIFVVLLLACFYTAPNFFGEAPAVQISPATATAQINADLRAQVASALQGVGMENAHISEDATSLRVQFDNTDVQLKAKDAISKALNRDAQNPDYTVALNLESRTPQWMRNLGANPMYLGLDLRGGVHFMYQVDMNAALDKKIDALGAEMRALSREKSIRHAGINRQGKNLEALFADAATLKQFKTDVLNNYPDLDVVETQEGLQSKLSLTLKPAAAVKVQEQALKQNIQTLHNRVNELGVSEPVIQQQGMDRIVVELPGIQDTARAKSILGRTATLEMRLIDESAEGHAAENGGLVPFGSEKFLDAKGVTYIAKRDVVVTGENLTDAQPSFDSQTNQPIVSLTMDTVGGRLVRDASSQNIKKRMAILLFEKGRGTVLTAPVIQSELGSRFQISGSMSTNAANDLALLLRAGSLAAPMEIIEERTVGPSLGKDNIAKGFNSVTWGFIAVTIFMCIYYAMFGLFSSLALGFNLLMLIAVLSMMQATLTLPGMAAMALALGMAIDSNVLINERVREELRAGQAPQKAISLGYEHAWGTILDSNITTLIAGLALLAYGTGPVRGFAVVHCLGILTSMFSAVVFSRGLVNLWYGRQKKLQSISIGTVWRPEGSATNSADSNDTELAQATK